MAGGRPQEYDRIAIGKEMVKWSKNPNALTVPMFATSKGMHSEMLRTWANQDAEFRSLFLQAKENVGINRLKSVQNNSLNEGIYKQTMHFYDLDIREDVHDEKRFEADLKKTENDYMNRKEISAIDFENLRMENEALRAKLAEREKGECQDS